jgi:hypothetical protein
MVTVRVSEQAMKKVREIAFAASTADHRVTSSDILRMALKAGLPSVEEELKR